MADQGWGWILRRSVYDVPGKLAGVKRILAPLRTTEPLKSDGPFDGVLKRTSPPKPHTIPYLRAWLIAVASEADLDELGLSDDELPTSYSATHLRPIVIANRPNAILPPKKRAKKQAKKRSRAPRSGPNS